jgi:hypothetical protein
MNADNLKKEVKKIKVWHVAVLCTGIFLAFAIIGSILIAAGGGGSWNVRGVNWKNLGMIGPGTVYDVNDRADLDLAGVDRITIATVSDDINLQNGTGLAELKGQCRSTNGPVKLETRKEGSRLYIEVKYPTFGSTNNSTDLTVTLPAEYNGDIDIHTVSGSINAGSMEQQLGNVNLGTISGDIDFYAKSFSSIKAGTTSGGVKLQAIAAETEVNTISGRVSLDYSAFAATSVNTISGDVTAQLPSEVACDLKFGTVSGDFRSSYEGLGVKNASHGFEGTIGSGGELLKVNTTSGNFKLEGK